MLEVTSAAQTQINAYFADTPVKPIRIFLNNGGCSGSQIAMVLDAPKENDEIFKIGGVDYLVDKALLVQAQPIAVDFGTTGFKISSNLQLNEGCSECGADSDCCSE